MSKIDLAPWAFTKLKAFEQCLRAGSAKYVTKEYPRIETEAMQTGTYFHKLMEDRINDGTPFPEEHARLEDLVPTHGLDTLLLKAEVKLGVTRDFAPCDFFDKKAWFRGVVDVFDLEGPDLCFIVDHKTGKRWEDPDELHLHSVLVKAHYPEVKHWRGFYLWLKERVPGEVYALSPGLSKTRLIQRVAVIEDALASGKGDTPTKGKLCPWCDLARCEYFTGTKSK